MYVNASTDVYAGNDVTATNNVTSGFDLYAGANVSGGNVAVRNVTECNTGFHLATDTVGDIYCEADAGGGGWGDDYFDISDGTSTETIDEFDTVNFTDGTNIDVVVSGTDTVTVNLNNDYLNDIDQYLNTSSNAQFGSVDATGYFNTSGNVSALGNLTVESDAQLNGNVALGSDTSDNVSFNGLVNTSIVPSQNNTYDFGSSAARWASVWANSANISASLSVGTTSILTGNVGIGAGVTTTKAKLSVNGVMSGVTLYATKSFSGAGLTDCDTAGTSKLLWDATTGRFSCGTDVNTAWSTTGSLRIAFDARYVNTSGDTMTGALAVQNGTVHAATATPLLNVRGTMSGRLLNISGSGSTPLLTTTSGKPTVRIGGSGSLVLEARSTDPGSAPANTVGLFAQKTAGRPMLMQSSGATLAATALQTALFGNQIMIIKPGGGATLTSEGTQTLDDTTVSHPAADQVFGFMANFATAATSGDEAGTSSSNTALFRGSTSGANGFFSMTRVGVVDTTSVRVFSGMADQTIATMVGADNPSGNYAGFQFSTVRGDSNWQFVTKDNSTQNVVNTGVAFTANKVYDLYFSCTKQCASVTWEIRNVTDGTSAQGTTASNLPSSTAALRMVLGVETQTTAVKNIRMQQMYVEADR
jgi:hypothetical protein